MTLTHPQPPLPFCRAGMKIGLFGGSFDPPHGGHAHIARTALIRLGLDQLWWLASPQNPLKARNPAPIAARLTAIERLVGHDRRHVASALEERLGTTASFDTIAALQTRCAGVRFVWVMGADNLATLHHWHRWQDLMTALPVAVLARPGHRLAARCSPAARRFRHAQRAEHEARAVPMAMAPAWCFMNLPMRPDSSTALRMHRA